MKKVLFILTILILTACDSPQNYRVYTDNENNKQKSEVQKSFEKLPFRFEAKWLLGPKGSLSQTSQLMVLIFDSSGKLTSLPKDKELQFYATMPSMGHPLEDPGFFEEADTGVFINKTIQFNMPGEWKMNLWITDMDYNILDESSWLEQL